MQDDVSIRPSHGWRLAAFALMVSCCGFTGWLLGHAVAMCAPLIDQLAQAIEDMRDVPMMQEFTARVSGS